MLYKIITDSACDLPQELFEKYNIEVIPINIYCGEEEYRDKIDITPEVIHKRMKEGDFFKTAQIPPNVFEERFREYAKKNEPCLYIAFSSGISSTYESSVVALRQIKEEYPECDIEVYDSKVTCGGLGLMVLKACEMLEDGCSKEELYEMLDFYKEHIESVFTVDDINYLCKGGRVSKASAFVGDLLNIKPILDMKEGSLRTLEKVRGTKKAHARMIQIIKERTDELPDQIISIGHSDDYETFEKFKDSLQKKVGFKEALSGMLGATVSAHTGPGILAIFFLNKKFDK